MEVLNLANYEKMNMNIFEYATTYTSRHWSSPGHRIEKMSNCNPVCPQFVKTQPSNVWLGRF